MSTIVSRRWFWVVVPVIVACDGGGGRPPGVVDDGGAQEVGRPDAVDAGAAGGPEAGVIDASAADLPVEEVGTYELPRIQADPTLTRMLLPAPAAWVSGDRATCTHAVGATGDRWCAFSRPGTPPTSELWVVNVTRLAAGDASVTCDGKSDGCVRLTAKLWTGTPIWGPSHPSAQRFEGDTLVFHADAVGAPDPYDGAIWAWRPGWKAPRKITGDHALFCFVEHRTTAAYCLDETVVEKKGSSPFDRPLLKEFDLRAGLLADEAGGQLPLVAHVRNATSDLGWRARFSADGALLAFSNAAAAGTGEALQIIKLADVGQRPPTTILADAAEWEIAHDGAKIYFLAGYDRSRGEAATGMLRLADFPSGAGVTPLVSSVLEYQLIGAQGERFSDADRGAVFTYPGAGGLPSVGLLRDRTKPDDLLILGTKAQGVQIGTDGRHALYFQNVRGSEFPVAFVARTDGSGSCQLTSDIHAESYGGQFTESATSVVWIEYFRYHSESEEGWYARPASCGEKTKFGDYVAWYAVLDDDFVIFEGGDFNDTTSWLQYTPLTTAPGQAWPSPRLVAEHPDSSVGVVRVGTGTWVLYSLSSHPSVGNNGLYLHGPLKAAP